MSAEQKLTPVGRKAHALLESLEQPDSSAHCAVATGSAFQRTWFVNEYKDGQISDRLFNSAESGRNCCTYTGETPDAKQIEVKLCRAEKIQRLPDKTGFVILAFPFNGEGDARLAYISNARREDVLNAMKEWLLKCGAAEDWMKHIK